MSKRNFIRLKTLDVECRCCGKGREAVCDTCHTLMHNGHIIYIELKDSSTVEKKKPTGYAVAILASKVKDTTPGIAFIHQSQLQNFMGNEYNNPKYRGAVKFITQSPERAKPQSTDRSRAAAELLVGRDTVRHGAHGGVSRNRKNLDSQPAHQELSAAEAL